LSSEVVPTISEGNPVLEDLLRTGATREVFVGIWVTGDVKSWSDVVGRGGRQPIQVYTRSDACGAAETWAKYLGKKQDDLLGVGVYGDPGVAEAIKRDALGIGFNNINYAYDPATKGPVAGIRVLPIDLNGNGRIDSGAELFGNHTGGKSFANGFDALAQYDDNRDGKIDAADAVFILKTFPHVDEEEIGMIAARASKRCSLSSSACADSNAA